MNKENMEKLISHLRTTEWAEEDEIGEHVRNKFNMDIVRFTCESPACIIGHAGALIDPKGWSRKAVFDRNLLVKEVAEWLDLPAFWTYHNIYYPQELPILLETISSTLAADSLQRILDAGENYDVMTQEEIWGQKP